VAGIIELLSADFLKLILVSLVIALPLGWYFMRKWLEGFAYRIEVEWWMFAAAGAAAIVIAATTISGQAVRAATANPVEAIKEE
jgi:putative ABC transport system permease protein